MLRAVPALTVKQPWATLIMMGIKDIENRMWLTGYRGPVFIHAGQKWDSDPWPKDPALEKFGLTHFTPDHFPRGVILGTVELVDLITDSKSLWAMPDHIHWVLKNPSLLDQPIAWRGQLGLWTPTGLTLTEE